MGEPPLSDGATLVAGQAGELRDSTSWPRLCLAVRSGPSAGLLRPLLRGVYRVGRGDGERAPLPGVIAISDPQLSRFHAELRVSDTSVEIIDRGSTNGIWVEGRRVRTAHLVAGQRVRMGSSELSLEFPDDVLLDSTAGLGYGQPLRVVRDAPFQRTTAMLAAAALPLLFGLGMAILTGQWMFLAFSGVSALTLLLPLAEAIRCRGAFARRISEALAEDLARRFAAAPDAAELGLAGEATARTNAARPRDLVVRLGVAALPADLQIDPEPPSKPAHAAVPLTVPLGGVIALRGSPRAIEGLARFLLLQLAAFPSCSEVTVVLAGGSRALRTDARFAPRITVLSEAELADAARTFARFSAERVVVVVVPDSSMGIEEDAVRACAEAAAARGYCVVDATRAVRPPNIVVDVDEFQGAVLRGASRQPFQPDLVPARSFEAGARALGRRAFAAEPSSLPGRLGLADIIPNTVGSLCAAWSKNANANGGLRVPVGRALHGPAEINLVSDGPHVLIAGTTGSGKSELLRTLVVSGAAAHSPARLTFLLIDFKGGAGLEPLAGLPHCVGLLTDLEDDMHRALASLRAELKRRERLLADLRCADIDDYAQQSSGEALPHLAIVVDEFRMLVEDAPESLAELLRVATIGRSLGIHLVLATQRPRGAVTADIRANIGSVIALRVASEEESRDILGSPDAARISTDIPGRAVLAVNGREPFEFQTGSLTSAPMPPDSERVELTSVEDWLSGARLPRGESSMTAALAAERFVRMTRMAWERMGGGSLRKPVAPPLPLEAGPTATGGLWIPLAIGDYPDSQETAVLSWAPEEQGHLALLGTRAGGVDVATAAVVGQLAGAEKERHLYLLDGDGSLTHLSGRRRVGAYADPSDLRLAARIIDRVADTAAAEGIPLILVVSAWGNWIAAFRQSAQASAEDRLLDVLRAAPRNITLVLSGERELAASRAFGALPCRLFFPLGVTAEAQLGWPALPSGAAVPLRAIATGPLSPGGPIAAQCFLPPDAEEPAPLDEHSSAVPPPIRVEPLPTVVMAADVGHRIQQGRRFRRAPTRSLAVGLGCDSEPVVLPLKPGEVLMALGRRRTGKTSLLAALPAMNPHLVWHHVTREWLAGSAPAEADLRQEPQAESPILLVDDADQLSAAESHALASAVRAGAVVVATADLRPGLLSRCPLVMPGTVVRSGIVLAPQSPADGEAFGARLEPLGRVPPGRGVAIAEGELTEVQLGTLG
ncbi:FtsK/SpoIIIE domain-containing protein [Sinomonas gamaensis]|uniref:FtsK/SpoIIIE domain-containing protein n=1 Tax=Sinomonas gamaensis TaxID=2565624 RepID=UPI0020167FC6|nr:FtsK/SpoIIIE domain-containing protein [Sinomonas gamaensis]